MTRKKPDIRYITNTFTFKRSGQRLYQLCQLQTFVRTSASAVSSFFHFIIFGLIYRFKPLPGVRKGLSMGKDCLYWLWFVTMGLAQTNEAVNLQLYLVS